MFTNLNLNFFFFFFFSCFLFQELEFQDLTAVLHCIHSFIAAKVASVDPVFIDSQSIARKYMYSNWYVTMANKLFS